MQIYTLIIILIFVYVTRSCNFDTFILVMSYA